MTTYASWVHGNAVTVESPENCRRVGHFGWGGDFSLMPGKASWFHIPLPTPVLVGGTRTKVQRLFAMFSAEGCEVRNVHVYDGSANVHQFDGLHARGEHRTGLDASNTFDLPAPHTVAFGMGITVLVQASIGYDTDITTRFIMSSAGGDFFT